MRRFFFVAIVITLVSANVFSQNSQVKIIDLSVVPLLSSDTTNQQNSTMMNVLFKVKNKELSKEVFYLFGTAPDVGDVLTTEGIFLNQGDAVYLKINGVQNEVTGYTASAVLKLNAQQYSSFSTITVYVEDIAGQITNKLYFKK